MPCASYSKWSPTRLGGGQIICLQSSHNVFSLNGLSSQTWNVGCTLISRGSSNLYTFFNTYSTIRNIYANLDMNFKVRPLDMVKSLTFINTFCPTLYFTLYLLVLACFLWRFWAFSNNLVSSKTCLCFWTKSSPSWLNSTVECASLRARSAIWSGSNS